MNKTILVIEDEEDIRNTLNIILQLEGYEVRLSSDGREALDVLEQGFRPDLILLDLMMPVLNGSQFLKLKKENSALEKIPVVLISAASKIEVLRPGVVDLLNKPVDLSVLLDTVRRACESAPELSTVQL